jgi:hypothetical protein
VWKTGLPVRSAVLKPHIERGKFLKSDLMFLAWVLVM